MSIFPVHTAETASPAARPAVAATERQFGFVPGPVARMAAAPSTLDGFTRLNGIFQRSSLGDVEREVLILTVATRHACHYCVAMHSSILARGADHEELVADLRTGRRLSDPRLEALRTFIHTVIDHAGAVPEERMHAFLDAGFSAENALDVVLGIATYTLSTFANRMTGAPLDEPFLTWEWEEPGSRSRRAAG